MHLHLPDFILSTSEVASRHFTVQVVCTVLVVQLLVHEALLACITVVFVVLLGPAFHNEAFDADEGVQGDLEPIGEGIVIIIIVVIIR